MDFVRHNQVIMRRYFNCYNIFSYFAIYTIIIIHHRKRESQMKNSFLVFTLAGTLLFGSVCIMPQDREQKPPKEAPGNIDRPRPHKEDQKKNKPPKPPRQDRKRFKAPRPPHKDHHKNKPPLPPRDEAK
jgi:hypothetical protein